MSVSSNPPGWVFFYKIITIVIIMIITKILIIIIITIETIYWTLRFISLSQRLLEITVSCLQGIVLVSCAGELLYSPGWQSPRDDASIKILVIFAIFWPQNYPIITQKLPSWEFSFHFVIFILLQLCYFIWYCSDPSFMSVSEAYSKPSRISKMELIAKKVKIFQPLTVFAKISILDVRQGSEYTSGHYFWLFLVIFWI